MIATVTYIQLNETSCIRETYHDDNLVSTEVLDKAEIPLQVQRLMLIPQNETLQTSALKDIIRMSPEEVYQAVLRAHKFEG